MMARDQPAQVAVAFRRLGQQGDREAVGQDHLRPEDRLDARRTAFLLKLNGRIEPVQIGKCDCGHPLLTGEGRQLHRRGQGRAEGIGGAVMEGDIHASRTGQGWVRWVISFTAIELFPLGAQWG